MPPIADVMPLSVPGMACTCPAFKLGEPTPEQAIKALARAAVVTVEDKGIKDGYRHYVAWTDPANRYEVASGQGRGGWCKHCFAVLFIDNPNLRQAALGADDLLSQMAELEKENRKLQREVERWKKK